MVGAGESLGVAQVGATHPHAAMPAEVQEGLDRSVLLANDQHRVGAHVGREEVAGLRDLALMREEQPCPTEESLELKLVDLLAREDMRTDKSLLRSRRMRSSDSLVIMDVPHSRLKPGLEEDRQVF